MARGGTRKVAFCFPGVLFKRNHARRWPKPCSMMARRPKEKLPMGGPLLAVVEMGRDPQSKSVLRSGMRKRGIVDQRHNDCGLISTSFPPRTKGMFSPPFPATLKKKRKETNKIYHTRHTQSKKIRKKKERKKKERKKTGQSPPSFFLFGGQPPEARRCFRTRRPGFSLQAAMKLTRATEVSMPMRQAAEGFEFESRIESRRLQIRSPFGEWGE